MPYSFTCPHCRRAFQDKNKRRHYCSKACMDAAQRTKVMHSLTCCGCGAGFVVPYAEQMYCSDACRRATERRRMERACGRCGKPVIRSRGNRNTAARHEVVYCNRRCQFPGYVGKVACVCATCRLPFSAYPRNGGNLPIYCSRACRAPAPHYTAACLACGDTFTIKKRGDRRQVYCSRRCFHCHAGETSIETLTRLALTALGVRFEPQHRVGRYRLDFYLPDRAVAIECDGEYWHEGRDDKARDAHIADTYGIRTIRLTESTIRRTPWLASLIARRLGMKDVQPMLPGLADATA